MNNVIRDGFLKLSSKINYKCNQYFKIPVSNRYYNVFVKKQKK